MREGHHHGALAPARGRGAPQGARPAESSLNHSVARECTFFDLSHGTLEKSGELQSEIWMRQREKKRWWNCGRRAVVQEKIVYYSRFVCCSRREEKERIIVIISFSFFLQINKYVVTESEKAVLPALRSGESDPSSRSPRLPAAAQTGPQCSWVNGRPIVAGWESPTAWAQSWRSSANTGNKTLLVSVCYKSVDLSQNADFQLQYQTQVYYHATLILLLYIMLQCFLLYFFYYHCLFVLFEYLFIVVHSFYWCFCIFAIHLLLQ